MSALSLLQSVDRFSAQKKKESNHNQLAGMLAHGSKRMIAEP